VTGDVADAELRILRAAERERLAGDGDADVDADHAGARVLGDVLGDGAVGREHRGGVAVLTLMLQCDRVLERGHVHDGEHGAEDLGVPDLHVGLHLVDHRRPDPRALRVLGAGGVLAATVDDDLRALFLGASDGALDAIERRLIDDGAHAFADHDGRRALDDAVDQVIDVADRHEHARRHAALPGAAGERVDDALHGDVLVGVGHHDQVILRAAEGERALAVSRGELVQRTRHGGRAYEGDRGDVLVGDERVHGVFSAVDDREDAGRKARRDHDLAEQVGRERNLLRRLEDEGIPERDGNREHPHRHHRREVERRDPGDDAERLATVFARDAAADFHAAAGVEVLDAERELDDLDALEHAGAGLGDRLARLAGGAVSDLVDAGQQELAILEEVLRALLDGHRLPLRLGGLGSGDDARDLVCRRHRDFADHAARVRARHVEEAGSLRARPGAADEVLKDLGFAREIDERHGFTGSVGVAPRIAPATSASRRETGQSIGRWRRKEARERAAVRHDGDGDRPPATWRPLWYIDAHGRAPREIRRGSGRPPCARSGRLGSHDPGRASRGRRQLAVRVSRLGVVAPGR
jgi:hypothetical protein